ncbi:MAG: hypothetical protein R2827_12745 [Bdellovibrionales bacterium]
MHLKATGSITSMRGRNHKSLITTSEYYAHCLKYVYRNPVKAKICELAENYKWSTLSQHNSKMIQLVSPITTGHQEHLPDNKTELLQWINTPLPNEIDAALSLASKKPIFSIKTQQHTKATRPKSPSV